MPNKPAEEAQELGADLGTVRQATTAAASADVAVAVSGGGRGAGGRRGRRGREADHRCGGQREHGRPCSGFLPVAVEAFRTLPTFSL